MNRGYDVIVVSDGCASGTPTHQAALDVMQASCAKVCNTKEIVTYMLEQYVCGDIGQVKGTTYADGRKDVPHYCP